MANHSPDPDNYVQKKTWAEVMEGATPAPVDAAKVDAERVKRAADKGEAAKNGGGASK